ncbi:hypothetical protein [Lysobacter gummosus]
MRVSSSWARFCRPVPLAAERAVFFARVGASGDAPSESFPRP